MNPIPVIAASSRPGQSIPCNQPYSTPTDPCCLLPPLLMVALRSQDHFRQQPTPVLLNHAKIRFSHTTHPDSQGHLPDELNTVNSFSGWLPTTACLPPVRLPQLDDQWKGTIPLWPYHWVAYIGLREPWRKQLKACDTVRQLCLWTSTLVDGVCVVLVVAVLGTTSWTSSILPSNNFPPRLGV